MRRDRVQSLLYVLAALVLALCLSVLVWLRSEYEASRRQSRDYMRSLFARDDVIRPPHDVASFRFGVVESLVEKSEASPFVRRVYVTKIVERPGAAPIEHPVHPFFPWAPSEGQWRDAVDGWTRLSLEEEGVDYGALYVEEDRSAAVAVQWAIGAVALMLIVTLGTLIARMAFQQSALVGAHEALAEKDRQLIRLERLSLVGLLSANIIHDIKKPVINIQNSVEDSEEALGREAVENIRGQTDLFLSILRDLGVERFVRSDDSDSEFCDIHDVLRQSCALVRYEKKGSTEVEWDLAQPAAPLALAPYHRLIQIFSNLILNAYQAMEGEGKLTLRTRVTEEQIIVDVTDNGPGVPAEMRARLFEPFESSKPEGEGTGLGLYICRSIVEGMEGRLYLGKSDVGARFVVELPLAN